MKNFKNCKQNTLLVYKSHIYISTLYLRVQYDRYGEDYEHMMNRILSGENMVFLASTDRLSSYNANNSIKIQRLRERFFLLPMCMYMQKESCLIEIFDRKLMDMSTTGLFSMWKRNFTTNHGFDSDRSVERFGLSKLECAFQVLALLFVFASIVFLLEIISTRIGVVRFFVDVLSD